MLYIYDRVQVEVMGQGMMEERDYKHIFKFCIL